LLDTIIEHYLDELVDRMLTVGPVVHLRIATLSFNARNVERMAAWIESGNVQRLSLLFSEFFRDHNEEIVSQAIETIVPPHKLAASRNHCKVVCLHFADDNKLVLEGSANLRNNGNSENLAFFVDAGLHDWHAQRIDEEIRKNEGNAHPNRPKS